MRKVDEAARGRWGRKRAVSDGLILRSVAFALVCSALLGCTAHRMYRPISIEEYPDYSLAFIELDDQGELWAPSQVERALDLIERKQARSPIALQVFVHGWNNSAAPREDEDDSGTVYNFRRVLTKVHDGIERASGMDVPVVGVFVGWRGQVTRLPGLRELSFYNRRGAAERIAGASATEVLYRILTTARRNPGSRSVLIGHSFGAAIVERTLSQAIIGSLLAAPGSEVPFPADLVVLFNPAGSASSAKQLVDILARNRLKTYRVDEEGNRYERPLLVSFTSEADVATRLLFPFGMSVKALGKRFRRYGSEQCSPISSQRWLYTHTAGHTPGLHSHTVTVGPRSADPAVESGGALRYRTDYDPVTQQVGLSFDGSRHRFTIRSKPRALNDTPYWIMRVPRELIPDHGTIFTDDIVALVNAIFELTGVMKAGRATTLVREDGVRPVVVLPRPDGTALFLDRSRGLYAVRRDSPRPVFLRCFSENLDPSDAIGLRLAGELAYVAFRRGGGSTPEARCHTLVVPFQVLADSYRPGRPLRVAGSGCFVSATFDLVDRRIYLGAEDSPTLLVADMGEHGARPRVLVELPGSDPLAALYFDRTVPRLFALQGAEGAVWEVDLRSDPPGAGRVASDLGWPTALTFDPGRRRLYVAEGREGRIWALDCRGPCRQAEPFLQPGLLTHPTSLEVGLDGTLWVGDPEANLVLAIAPDGEVLGSIRSLSRAPAAEETPSRVPAGDG